MYSYRYAELDDVSSIVALVQSAYRGETSRRGWTTEADLIDGQRTDDDEVRQLIAQVNSFILLCEHQGEILASVNVQQRGSLGYLGMFAVHPDHQGRGIGRQLLAQAEVIVFRNWHCSVLQMTVISLRQDLIAWYERRGFVTTDEFEPFPYGEPRFGLPRRDDLVLRILRKHADAQ